MLDWFRTTTTMRAPGTVNTRDREESLPVYLTDRPFALSASHQLCFVSMNQRSHACCYRKIDAKEEEKPNIVL